MPVNNSGGIRGYIRSSKTYYKVGNDNDPVRVMVGMYFPLGGTTGEFTFEWEKLQQGKPPYAKLTVWEDAWDVLVSQFGDLLEKLKELNETAIQEPEFCKILDSLGIKDITKY